MRSSIALARFLGIWAASGDEIGHIVALVGAYGLARFSGLRRQHLDARLTFSHAGGVGQPVVDHQPIEILHQRMAHVIRQRLGILALGIEQRIRVGKAFMGIVGARAAAEVGKLTSRLLVEPLDGGGGLFMGTKRLCEA